MILTGLSFIQSTTLFNVYRGPNPTQLFQIASAQPVAAEFVDTGLPGGAGGPRRSRGAALQDAEALAALLRGAGAEGLPRCEVQSRLVAPVADTTRLLDRLERMLHSAA